MTGSEDGGDFDNGIAKTSEAVMGRWVEVTSSGIRDVDVTKVAEQLRRDEVLDMSLEDTKGQVERSLIQDGKSFLGDILTDQKDRWTDLLNLRSRLLGVRCGGQKFQIVTAVLVD